MASCSLAIYKCLSIVYQEFCALFSYRSGFFVEIGPLICWTYSCDQLQWSLLLLLLLLFVSISLWPWDSFSYFMQHKRMTAPLPVSEQWIRLSSMSYRVASDGWSRHRWRPSCSLNKWLDYQHSLAVNEEDSSCLRPTIVHWLQSTQQFPHDLSNYKSCVCGPSTTTQELRCIIIEWLSLLPGRTSYYHHDNICDLRNSRYLLLLFTVWFWGSPWQSIRQSISFKHIIVLTDFTMMCLMCIKSPVHFPTTDFLVRKHWATKVSLQFSVQNMCTKYVEIPG